MEQIDLGLCWLVSFDRVGWKQLHLGLSRWGLNCCLMIFPPKNMFFFCFEEMNWCVSGIFVNKDSCCQV